jgi:hypothetical protein
MSVKMLLYVYEISFEAACEPWVTFNWPLPVAASIREERLRSLCPPYGALEQLFTLCIVGVYWPERISKRSHFRIMLMKQGLVKCLPNQLVINPN